MKPVVMIIKTYYRLLFYCVAAYTKKLLITG